MKRYGAGVVLTLVLGALIAWTAGASAQEAKKERKGEGRGQGLEQRVERVATELDLKPEQKTKIKAAFEAEAKKMQDLRADTSLTPEQRREKFQAMREEMNKKMKEILTAEQYQKWEKMRADMRKRGPGGEEKKGERKGQKQEN